MVRDSFSSSFLLNPDPLYISPGTIIRTLPTLRRWMSLDTFAFYCQRLSCENVGNITTWYYFRSRIKFQLILGNKMYMVTSEVLNKYTGDHKQFIQDRILNPVGMSSTTFSEVKAKRTGHFSSSWDNSSHGRQIPYWFPEPTANFMSAAGGLISSANDMVNSPYQKDV